MPENGSIEIIHAGTAGYGFGKSTTEVKRFQTFIASPYCTRIVDVRVKLRQIAGANFSSPNIELYATANGKPTGAAIARGSLNTVGTSFEVTWGPLGSSGLVPGKEYALVLSADTYPDPANDTRFEWAVAPVYGHLHFGKWNGSSWIDESGLGNGWLQIGVADADSAINVTHSGTSGNAFGQTGDQIKRFQTFLASDDQPIVGIDIKVRKLSGTNHSDITVELYDTAGHAPTGSPLASAAVTAASVGSDWTIVTAPLHYPKMVFEREYAVVLSQRTTGSAVYEWAVSPANKATSFGKWNGDSWVNESGLGDGWLKVWVMSPYLVSTVDITHSGSRGYGFGNVTDEVKRYQTVSLPGSMTVIGVDLKVRKYSGTTQSNLTAEFYATSGGRPIGTPIASGVLPPFHVGGDWTTVHIPIKSHPLAAGIYALVVSQRSLSSARYEWAVAQVRSSISFGKWNGSSWIDESNLGDGWARIWMTDADVDVDVSHASTIGNGFGNTIDEIKRYQTFIAPYAAAESVAYDMTGVQLKVRKFNGSDQSDVVVDLYETVANKPIGFPMATAVVASNCIGTDWTIVNAPLSYKCDWFGRGIVPGKEYAIVLSQRHGRSARYEWARSAVSSSLQFGKWNGSSWIDESGLGDGWLKVSLIQRVGPN